MGIFYSGGDKDLHGLNHEVCGIVKDIYADYVILDIGIGEIKVENYFPEAFIFSVGDKIKIRHRSVDLRKIW